MQQHIINSKWLNHKTFGILISILFLFLIFHNINIPQIGASMKSFNIMYAIPAFLTYTLSYIIRTFRWKELLSVSKNINYSSVLKALYIGYMANTLLPARMGELYRAHILGTEQNIKRSSVLASIVVERIFDGLTLFSLLAFIIIFYYNKPWLLKICITTGIIFLSSFLIIAIVSKKTHLNTIFLRYTTKFLPAFIKSKLETIITSFVEGLAVLTSFKALAFIITTSILVWFLEWCTMYIIVLGFELPEPVQFLAIDLLLVLVAFSTMIPSGPAFVGPYQYAFILALDVSLISKSTAVAIAITTQAAMMGPVVIIGMILLWKSHLSLGKLPVEPSQNQCE